MKNRYRTLGIGFLISAVIVAVFAIFVQGYSPKGVNVTSLFSKSANRSEVASYREEVESLTEELNSNKTTRNQLNETIASLKEDKAKLEKEVTSLKRNSNQSQRNQNQNDDNDSDQNNTNTQDTALTGSFTISEGQASSEIAQNLADQGFISSADELLNLIDEWALHSAIQTGTYDLRSDMSVHDIASVITQGAYYYN